MEDKAPGPTDKTNGDKRDDERIVRVIQRDDFELWCDPRAKSRIDKINDNDRFYIEGMGIKFTGEFLKSRSFREMVLYNIKANKEREDYERSCYPSARDVQVYLARDRPRVYLINARFDPARALAEDMGMPVEGDTHYVLCLYTGSLFKRNHERYEQFKKYSLEIFGLSIDLPSPAPDPIPLRVPLPDPSQYKSEPTYYWWNGFNLVQVWRRRIFPCPVESLKSTLAEPLSPKEPQTLYLEERWHPVTGLHVNIGGPSKIVSQVVKRNRFETDAFAILDYHSKKGRKIGSKIYRTKEEFQDAVRKAISEFEDLTGSRPNQTQVIAHMEISPSTFYLYINDHELEWPQDFKS